MDFTSDDALESLVSHDPHVISTNGREKKIGDKDFSIPKGGVMAEKRPYDRRNRYGEPPSKKPAPTIRIGGGFKWNLQALANAADAVESGGKSPVSALNELGVKVAYSVLRQGGPAHCPSFTIAVTLYQPYVNPLLAIDLLIASDLPSESILFVRL